MGKFVKMMMLVALVGAIALAGCEKKAEEKHGDKHAEQCGDKHAETCGHKDGETHAAKEPGMPILFSFETDASVAAWEIEKDQDIDKATKTEVSTENATDGKRSLKMELTTHDWPGTFTTTMAKDWSDYKTLKIDVTVMQDCKLSVRIDDDDTTDYETRFQATQDLVTGKDTITIVLDDVAEDISLKKIARIVLFAGGSDIPDSSTC